jgi:hypothetical protein
MFRHVAGALVLTAAVAYPGPALPGTGAALPKADEFVRAAVYDGLAADGVSPLLAEELARNPDFIKGCGLCEATHKAITEYAKLAKAPAAKPGRGLAQETVKKLRSEDRDVRLAALRDLISRYMGFAYDKANLPAAQRAVLEQRVKAMVLQLKNPEDGLPMGLPFCPSCDGACKKPPGVISQ